LNQSASGDTIRRNSKKKAFVFLTEYSSFIREYPLGSFRYCIVHLSIQYHSEPIHLVESFIFIMVCCLVATRPMCSSGPLGSQSKSISTRFAYIHQSQVAYSTSGHTSYSIVICYYSCSHYVTAVVGGINSYLIFTDKELCFFYKKY